MSAIGVLRLRTLRVLRSGWQGGCERCALCAQDDRRGAGGENLSPNEDCSRLQL